jgi:hypothetical protein
MNKKKGGEETNLLTSLLHSYYKAKEFQTATNKAYIDQ